MNKHNPKHRKKIFRRHAEHVHGPESSGLKSETHTSVRVSAIRYSATDLLERDLKSPHEITALRQPNSILWINIDGITDPTWLHTVGEVFNLHPLALEDSVHVHQRAKVEEYDEHLFIVVRMATRNGHLSTEQVSLFLGKDFVVTVQELPGGDCLDPVRQRLRSNSGRIRKSGTDYLTYNLIDAVVDSYFPVLEQFGEELDILDSRADGSSPDALDQLHSIRQELLQLRRAAWPHRDALNALQRHDSSLIATDTKVFLRDCYDHSVQIIDVLETQREMCADLRDLVLTMVGHRTNEIMRVLTIMSTIFIPLSFIAGVYGMNFKTETSPWNMPELGWRYGYPFSLSLMVGTAAVLLFFFYRKGWFWKSR